MAKLLLALLLLGPTAGGLAGPALAPTSAAPPAALRPAPVRDLDVAVPPGSPLGWSRAFPGLQPGPRLFPEARDGASPTAAAGPAPPVSGADAVGRSSAKPARSQASSRVSSSFGLLRILTWDLTAHIAWLRDSRGAGTSAGGAIDGSHDLLYWATMAPLLRLLMHGDTVSQAATLAHLVELGEPTLAVLDAARAEKALREPIEHLRRLIVPSPAAAFPAPGPSRDREGMLRRFVLDELLRSHPFDPESSFGLRLFRFGSELEPYVRAHVRSPIPLLRRNAVLALGRYETREAYDTLVQVAAETEDAVVLMRALAPLGRTGAPVSTTRLETRLRSEWAREQPDAVIEVALLGALARLGADALVPELLEHAEDALRDKDTDRLIAQLEALACLRRRDHADAVLAFSKRLSQKVRGNPRGYRPKHAKTGTAPDAPDPQESCATLMLELAELTRLGQDPSDEEHAEALLEFADKSTETGWRGNANQSFGRIQPCARYLYLDALPRLGEPGAQALLRVVDDRTADVELRGHALALLPWELRSERAVTLLTGSVREPALETQAFEVMVFDSHARLEEIARKLLVDCAGLEPGPERAEERYLYLRALQVLGARGALKTADLLPLLPLAAAGVGQTGTMPLRVRALVQHLVAAAAGVARESELVRRIDEIVDLVLVHRLNPQLGEKEREATRRFVLGQLSSVKQSQRDLGYEVLVVDAIVRHVLGRDVGNENAPKLFAPRVLLEEELLLALGRTEEPEAVAALRGFLEERDNPRRAEACLALGLAGDPSASGVLIRYLLDDDGFVRFCASESLRHLTGKEHFADWLYGPAAERSAAAEKYWAEWSEAK